MDPNSTNAQNSSLDPQMPATPQPVSPDTPNTAQPIQPMAATPGAPSAVGNPASPKSSRNIIVGVIVALLLLIIGLFVLFTMIFSDSAKAKKTANNFMAAITKEDITKALTYVENPGSAETAFFTTAGSQVKGSYTFKQSTLKDGTFYALYNLTGTKNTSARTELKKSSNKWFITGFVYDAQQLTLVPNTSNEKKKSVTNPNSTAPRVTGALACLEQDDYKWFEYNKQPSTVTFDDTYDPAKFTNNKKGGMYFKPDSLQEDSFTSVYDDWADFAKHNENKQWKFRLEGSTFGSDATTAAAKQFALQRSERVKAALVSRGVPESRIIIDPPHDYSNEIQDATDKIYRRVENTVDPTCTATTATSE